MSKNIRIVSPAKAIASEYIDHAITFLEHNSFEVQLGGHVLGQHHYFSGTDRERIHDFQAAIDDDTVDIILCARGGYGAIRIVDQIDYSALERKSKLVVGYSDITVFHHHINKHLNLPTIHATMPLNFKQNSKESLNSLMKAMKGEPNFYEIPGHESNLQGKGKGKLIGGNLAVIYALIGTNSDVNFTDKILFIEDVGEYIYSIDRMLWALDKAGKLSRLQGLIIGGMTNIKDTEIGFGQSVNDIILERVSAYGYPVSFNFPAGHLNDNRALVLGREALLTVKKESVTLLN